MRKLKTPTEPLACRLPIQMAKEVIAHGEELGMGRSEIVQHLITVSFYGDQKLKDLEQRILDSEARMEHFKNENEKLKKHNPWTVDPLKSKLDAILKNEAILIGLFEKYKRKSFPFTELQQAGYSFDYQLSPVKIGDTYYSFLIQHGWGYADDTREKVMIRRDH